MSIVAETTRGQLRLEGNESITDAKDIDPAAHRVGSRFVPGECGGGGKHSFDIITDVHEGNRRVEAAVIVGGFNGTDGEIGISIWNGRDFSDIQDSDQKKVVEMRSGEVEFKVPVKFSGGVIGTAGDRASSFASPNGRFLTAFQDDGHMVTYDTHHPAWGTNRPDAAAVWSNWHGLLRPLPW